MEKKFIKVDDLVRDYLSNRESEEPRPGSWQSMRELLDKEMPQKAAPFWGKNNSQKYLGLLALLFITATAGLGYRFITQQSTKIKPTTQINKETILKSINNPSTQLAPIAQSVRQTNATKIAAPSAHQPIAMKSAILKPTHKINTITSSTHPLLSSTTPKVNIPSPIKQLPIAKTINAAESKTGSKNTTDIVQKDNNQNYLDPKKPLDKAASAKQENNVDPIQNNFVLNSNVKPEAVINSLKTLDEIKRSNPRYIIHHDTLDKVSLIKRTNKNKETNKKEFYFDTLQKSKMIVDRIEETTTSDANNTLSASANISKTAKPIVANTKVEKNNLVPLDNFKTASENKNLYLKQKSVFANFKYNIKLIATQIHFYPGMVLGFDDAPALNGGNIGGFHTGFSGLWNINKFWSFLTEIKYLQRFNNGGIIDNSYEQKSNITTTTVQVGQERFRQYQWSSDSISHFFKYASYHSLELPLYIRYNINRLFLQCGLSGLFTFNTAVEEVETPKGNIHSNQATYALNNDNFEQEHPEKTIYSSDFKSRLGMGYLLGAGYQLSPAMQVDLRMSKNIWDNTATTGSKIVSNNLFKLPSFQVTFGYRFSQNRKR